ncbi:hypothetical protein [Sphingomonas endolithica]|uniref:hypothetical protein n=1 Tax=Sphingomonas endolithica TaxID=2972485 RepID=UPI0021AF2F88|nr:hypothetical protein [Sphingomonas sp. ZFBP2030]
MQAIRLLIASASVQRGIATLGALLICMLAGVSVARAGCMPVPTQELRSLAELADRNPAAVVAATERDNANVMTASRFGWRQAARAEAYDTLSRPADARRIAQRMTERDTASRSALDVELLTGYAMDGFRVEEIAHAVPMVEAARQHQVRRSAADACLQIALGDLQRIEGTPERAVASLTEAYRATLQARLKQQHTLATEKLARVIDWAGDHLQAVSLIEEVIAWD